MKRLADRPIHAAAALLVALTLALAACAPAAGSRTSVPIRAGADAIPVQRGQTVFVRVDYSLEEFDVEENDLNAAMWVPSGYASEVGNVTNYFNLRDVEGASGWSIDLSRMMLERTTVTSPSFATTTVVRELWAEIEVVVPQDAIAGVYRVRGNLQVRTGAVRPVAFRVEVRN